MRYVIRASLGRIVDTRAVIPADCNTRITGRSSWLHWHVFEVMPVCPVSAQQPWSNGVCFMLDADTGYVGYVMDFSIRQSV